jgi:5-formyltetrahydrofolate cyclo-ligase
VGFDKNKNRIGMGGGFYDRALSFKKNQTLFFAFDAIFFWQTVLARSL